MRIIIAGDFCPQDRVEKSFSEGNWKSVLGNVKPIVAMADYSLINFECCVTKGGEKPIEKQGPNLCCSENGLKALKWAGFNGVTLANNHIKDYGEEGVENTLNACAKYGFDIVGGGKNLQEASKVLYRLIGKNTLAVINCCEHEFSIATENRGGSSPLNPIQQYYAIREAKEKADYILMIVHGGHEHYQLPSPRMQETYRFFIDAGADAVINHHQHCYSGYEVYQGKPIFYGIGNFCFDKKGRRKGMWNEGYLVLLDLNQTVQFEILPYIQCSDDAKVTIVESSAYSENIRHLNAIIANNKMLNEASNRFFSSQATHYSDVFEPSINRYYLALKHRGWLPSQISHKKRLRLANYICCESHHDILKFIFKR